MKFSKFVKLRDQYDLNLMQMMILAKLSGCPLAEKRDLYCCDRTKACKQLQISKSSWTKGIQKLIKKGLIERVDMIQLEDSNAANRHSAFRLSKDAFWC